MFDIIINKSKLTILLTLCLLLLLILIPTDAKANQTIKINIAGKAINSDVTPYLKEGRTMVPLRVIAEGLGYNVNWNNKEQKITINNQDIEITMFINKLDALQNNSNFKLNTAPTIKYSRAYVPLRDVSHCFKKDVHWDGASRTVFINGDRYELPKSEYPDLTKEEQELARLINEHRVKLNLEPFTLSKSLTTVARAHVKDSIENRPESNRDERGFIGNIHSWSDKGPWVPVTYTNDDKYVDLLYSKPSELTAYKENGYEISFKGTHISPYNTVLGWTESPPINAIITGKNSWSKLTTMGVAINGNYSHVWFGDAEDPAGYY